MKRPWLDRPVAAACLLAAVVAVAASGLASGGGGSRSLRGGSSAYAVTLRHYGVDAREMERTIAGPLEDALYAIPSVESVTTTSETGRVRAYASYRRGGEETYGAVREAAQRVYARLPRSAQRPEIASSGDSRVPVWAAAFSLAEGKDASGATLGSLLERVVKPALQGIAGVGEVETSGTGLEEVRVDIDPASAAARGADAAGIAAALAADDAVLPGGRAVEGDRVLPVVVDGRYESLEELRKALVPAGGPMRLEAVAWVGSGERKPDVLSRLDGKAAAVVSVLAAPGARLEDLSRDAAEILGGLAEQGIESAVLTDRGAEAAGARKAALAAAVQGAAAVALASILLTGGAGWLAAASVPVIMLVAAALLAAAGLPLDNLVLGGLAAGAGSAVDAAILTSERLSCCVDAASGRAALSRIAPSLIAGAFTTVAALLPLGALPSAPEAALAVVWAIGATVLVALFIALAVLPPLLLADARRRTRKDEAPPDGVSGGTGKRPFRIPAGLRRAEVRLKRGAARVLASAVSACVRRPILPVAAAAALTIAGAAFLVRAGVDAAGEPSEDTIYARVEFEGGLHAEAVDRIMADYADALGRRVGIERVQTGSSTGSGTVLVKFDPKKMDAAAAREAARKTGAAGGFVYVPESSRSERIWTVMVAGEDDEVCRRHAAAIARACSRLPAVRETVLNFKDGSERLSLVPDREAAAAAGLSFQRAADVLRRAVHAPPAYKRLGAEGEVDVRVRAGTGGIPDREAVLSLPISSGKEGVVFAVRTILRPQPGVEPSSIRREDRRRVASVSVRTAAMDPRRARYLVMPAARAVEPPRGYSVEFDRASIQEAEALSGAAALFVLSILACFAVVAASTESMSLACIALASIPPSVALPALVLSFSGLPVGPAAAAALVAVSGMTVNAAVLSADEGRRRGAGRGPLASYRAVRACAPALLATSATTVAGALPFVFLGTRANAVVRSLALTTALGVGASFVLSLTLIPALGRIAYRISEKRRRPSG